MFVLTAAPIAQREPSPDPRVYSKPVRAESIVRRAILLFARCSLLSPAQVFPAIVEFYPNATASVICRRASDGPERRGVCRRALRRKSTGGVRHSRRAAWPVERSDSSVGKSHADRSDVRGRVQQPGGRLRARRHARQSGRAVRARAEARTEQCPGTAEFRTVQGNP